MTDSSATAFQPLDDASRGYLRSVRINGGKMPITIGDKAKAQKCRISAHHPRRDNGEADRPRSGLSRPSDEGALMDIFDNLPPGVRQAIAFASFEFAPRFAVKLLGRGVSAERAAEIIRDTDLRLARKGGAA